NQPSRSDGSSGEAKPQSNPQNAPQGGESDVFRKKGGGNSNRNNQERTDRSPNQDDRHGGRVPLEGRQVPLEGRRVPLEGRRIFPDQRPEPNVPIPLREGNLPALVRQVEGVDPNRYRDRFVILPIYPERRYSSRYYYVEYRFGNIRFSYYYYSVQPEPYLVCFAPYYYYYPLPPFVMAHRVIYSPPARRIVVEVPVFLDAPYYLERSDPNFNWEQRERQQVLNDLRAMWLLRDPSILQRYVRPGSQIAVYLDGRYAYSVPAEDYTEMTRDALMAVKTEQIRFTRVTKRGENELIFRGEHRYIDDATGNLRVVYISYTLVKVDGRWYISEVGSSANPIR
ncbi:MAG: hypothetical protein SNJ72_03560, partial [Fimbriimonadales bacterium]